MGLGQGADHSIQERAEEGLVVLELHDSAMYSAIIVVASRLRVTSQIILNEQKITESGNVTVATAQGFQTARRYKVEHVITIHGCCIVT